MDEPFEKLTDELQERNIDIEEYYKFLIEKNTSFLSSITNTKLASYNIHQPLSPELLRLKKIGYKLLSEEKISLEELNQVLQKIGLNNLSVKSVLQQLHLKNQIDEKNLLALEDENWTPLLESQHLFRFGLKEGKPEFYLVKPILKEREKTYGHYHVLEEIARGGMGIVFKVYHPGLNRIYALKVSLGGAGSSSHESKRFHQEIQTSAKLNHPNIVQILDSGEQENEHYFVMEYVEGESLHQWLKKHHSLRERLTLIQKSLSTLHYAHQQGIIHRDLKPENILVTKEGEPKITDFGLARDLKITGESQRLTRAGMVFGTPAYMPPEQVNGEVKEIDEQSDVYSMGVCLYEVLTNLRPFMAETEPQLFDKIFEEDPLPPSYLVSEIHRDLDTIVLKAMEKLKVDRYENAQEFADDLQRFIDGYPIKARPAGILERSLKWLRRNKQNAFILSLLFLFIVAFTGYYFWNKKQIQYARNNLIKTEKIKRQRERKKKFQKAFNQAQNFWDRSVALKENYRGAKIKYLLKAFSLLNTAYSIRPSEQKKVEEKKWEVGKRLIEIACATEDYQLADYIVTELQALSFLSNQEKTDLNSIVQNAKTLTLRTHQNRLEHWLTLFKTTRLKKGLKEKALREISKMQEKKIFTRLRYLLTEAVQYYLKSSSETVQQNEYYNTIVKALGWLENPEAGEPLSIALTELSQIVSKESLFQRSVSKKQFMLLLVEALANSKAVNYSKVLAKVRWDMGVNDTLFWDGTQFAYQQLAKLDGLDENNPEDAYGYATRAFLQYQNGNHQSAVEDYTIASELEPNNPYIYINRGNVKVKLEDYDGAIKDFDKALHFHPKNPLIYDNRGLAYYFKEDYAEALKNFEEAIRLNPDYAEAYNNRAMIWQAEKNYKKAIKGYSQAISLNPSYVNAYLNRGKIWLLKEDYNEAILDFNTVLKLNPTTESAFNLRGIAKRENQNFAGALRDFEEAIHLNPKFSQAYFNRGLTKQLLKDYPGALADFNEVLFLNPKMSQAYHNRGVIKNAIGNYDEAISDYNLDLKYNPTNNFKAYFSRGLTKFNKGDLNGAIEDYSKSIQINPNNPNSYYNRGSTYASLSKFSAAIQDFNQVLKLAPQFSKVYSYRGIAYLKQKQFQKAIEDLNQAIQENPKNTEAYSGRGYAWLALKEYEKAFQNFNEVLRLNPQEARAYHNCGNIFFEVGQDEEAIKYFEKAIELKYKDSEHSYKFLGRIYGRQKKIAKAIQSFEKAIAINPFFIDAHFYLGIAKILEGKPTAAILHFTKVIEIDPEFWEAYFKRGVLREQQKLHKEALADFNKAIQLKPKKIDLHLNRGVIYYHLNNIEAAIKDYSMVIQLAPNYATGHHFLGNAKYSINDFKGASLAYSEAIRCNPTLTQAFLFRGISNYKQGYIEPAKADLQMTLKLNPKEGNAFYHLGNIFRQQNEKSNALTAFKKAIELEISASNKEDALKQIEQLKE